MLHDEFPSEHDIDADLEGAFQRFDAAITGALRKRDSLAACYEIIDPYTASQIRTAAHRAEFAGEEFATWTKLARERAGYGAQDLAADPR